MGEYIIILVAFYTIQHGLEVAPLGLPEGFPLPVFGKIHIDIIHKVDGAQHEIVAALGQLLLHAFLIIIVQAIFHASANGQAGNLQIVVFCAVIIQIKEHGLLPAFTQIIPVIGKADFLQSGVQGCVCQLGAGIVAIEGNPGVNVKIIHGLFPPKTDGMRWAVLSATGFLLRSTTGSTPASGRFPDRTPANSIECV